MESREQRRGRNYGTGIAIGIGLGNSRAGIAISVAIVADERAERARTRIVQDAKAEPVARTQAKLRDQE